jgi:hypothetical protein
MGSAVLELQGAIVSLLKADNAVANIVGNRVYDHVPRSPQTEAITAQFPFVGIASSDEQSELIDCIDGIDLSLDIDCWSREPGFPEVRRLAHAMRSALHDVDITLSENGLVLLQHRETRTFRDPDGLTSHAVLTFEAFLEQN